VKVVLNTLDGKENNTSLTPPLFIEVYVQRQESERSCIDVLVVSNLSLSTIFLSDFGTVVHVIAELLIVAFVDDDLFHKHNIIAFYNVLYHVYKFVFTGHNTFECEFCISSR